MMLQVHELLDFLGITKKLGCGHEGCVYSTDHGTVVKVGVLDPDFDDLAVAALFQQLAGKHPVVPRVFGFDKLDVSHAMFTGGKPFGWVEREPLNDVMLSDEGEAQFSDDVGRVLANVYGATAPRRFPSYVPKNDQRILREMLAGHQWLKERGIELGDHNNSQNWGMRANGEVVVRDFGVIELHPDLIAKWSKS